MSDAFPHLRSGVFTGLHIRKDTLDCWFRNRHYEGGYDSGLLETFVSLHPSTGRIFRTQQTLLTKRLLLRRESIL